MPVSLLPRDNTYLRNPRPYPQHIGHPLYPDAHPCAVSPVGPRKRLLGHRTHKIYAVAEVSIKFLCSHLQIAPVSAHGRLGFYLQPCHAVCSIIYRDRQIIVGFVVISNDSSGGFLELVCSFRLFYLFFHCF